MTESTDAAGNTATAYSIAVAQSAQGQISSLGDHDWFAVNLVAGQTYTFALTGTGTNNLQDPYLRLYAGNGTTLLVENDDGLPGLNSIFTYTPTTTGTHYIDAGAWDNAGTGQYGLSITAGGRASFDLLMGAGVIDTDLSWSGTPGTGATVSYSFRQTTNGNAPNFSQLSATQMAAIHTALQQFSEVANLTFDEVTPGGYTNNAIILFSNYRANDGAGAYAYYPGSIAFTSNAGDVWFNLNSVSTTSLPFGSYSFFVGLHEIGHAVGLSHPGRYNAAPGVSITYANNAQFAEDTHQYTVMSYFDEANSGAALGGYPETLMLHDVYALQQIYGANTATRTGDTVYGFGSNAGAVFDFANTTPALCIWDAGGSDTLNCSGYSQNEVINLNEGTFSNIGGRTANVSIALGVTIEKAIGGSGSDTITGNSADNTLTGGGGNDVLIGGPGADSLVGGTGIDAADYSSSSAAVNVNLATGSGSGGAAQGDALGSIENLIGSAFSDTLTGDGGDNSLVGGLGADTLTGGGGTDTADYSSSSAAVTVNLQTGSGSGGDAQGDTLSGIENIIGSAFGDMLTGDGNANTLEGGRGVDTAVFAGLRSAYTTTHNGNTLVVSGPDGLDTLTHIEKLTFDNGTVLSGLGPVHSDFTGDSTSDLLWRHDSGQIYFWNMNGLQTNGEGGVAHAPVPNDWHVQGSGDFNADGNSDILWRHDSGQLYFWEMDGLQVAGEGAVAHAAVPNDWHIQGTGDFNADGNSDILWRHDSGQVYFWEMDGLQIKGEGAVAHAAVPNDWHVQGIGDFNGDTNSDILWRHDSGQVYFWEMDGLQIKGEGPVAHAAVPNDWHVQGIGDFDGDGKSDILWRHDSGQVYIWEMNGLNIKTEGTIAHAAIANDWHVQDIGDFNDDGNSDILWRNDNGQVYIWEMNGLQIKAEGSVAHAAVSNDWHIQA